MGNPSRTLPVLRFSLTLNPLLSHLLQAQTYRNGTLLTQKSSTPRITPTSKFSTVNLAKDAELLSSYVSDALVRCLVFIFTIRLRNNSLTLVNYTKGFDTNFQSYESTNSGKLRSGMHLFSLYYFLFSPFLGQFLSLRQLRGCREVLTQNPCLK